MRNFKFKLQSVLRLRKQARDHSISQHCAMLRKIALLKQQLADMQSAMVETDSRTGASPTYQPSLGSQQWQEAQRYRTYLNEQITQLRQELSQIGQRADTIELQMKNAEKEYRALVRLRQNQWEQWLATQRKLLQNEQDEAGSRQTRNAA